MIGIPKQFERITTFTEYQEVVDAYFNNHFPLVILVGRPGLSKSYKFQTKIEQQKTGVVISNIVSLPMVYVRCFEHIDQHIVIDDAEIIWGDNAGRLFLRGLTQERKPCRVSWDKQNKWMESREIPQHFKTSSHVCLICNHFAFGNADEYAAIADRSTCKVYFDPTAHEVHKNAEWVFEEYKQYKEEIKAIYDFVGSRLDYMPDLSFRAYKHALDQMLAKRDWRKVIETSYCVQGDERVVVELEKNKKLDVNQKVEQFIERTNKSRATYFRIKAEVCRHKDTGKSVVKNKVRKPKKGET